MPSVETIYQESIRPLPVVDQKRLADLILKNVNGEPDSLRTRRSVIDILDDHPVKRVFEDSKEVDEWLRTERDSWDD